MKTDFPGQRPLRIGHRGASGHAPENTLRAITKGIELGVDYVEIDVQRTRDGRLVVMHDKRVDRTTKAHGLVREMSWEELRALNAGDGESIPSLEEVLSLASNQTGVMLEIITPGIASQVCAIVASSGFVGPMIYASFHHAEILEARRCAPDAKTLALIEGVPVSGATFASDAQATHVGISLDSLTPAFVKLLQAAGLAVFAYTVDQTEDIEWLRRLPVEGIISNYPELV